MKILLDRSRYNAKFNKMSNFTDIELYRFSQIFGALANPNRLRIFLQLVSCCMPGTSCPAEDELGACVCEIGKGLSIVPSTVSHHLKELRRSGIIQMKRRGKNVECRVDPGILKELVEFFSRPTQE